MVSFILSTIIFFSLDIVISNYDALTQKSSLKAGFQVDHQTENIPSNPNEIEEKETEEIMEWYLEIPSIQLKANIQEGTTKEIMDQAIGHFEDTSKNIGNVGLAAHNRGYAKNYFENLKNLKEGDVIYYQYQNTKREYVVTKHCIIQDTDWTNLEETEENIITLITCVENQPEYRRCVQGKEK